MHPSRFPRDKRSDACLVGEEDTHATKQSERTSKLSSRAIPGHICLPTHTLFDVRTSTLRGETITSKMWAIRHNEEGKKERGREREREREREVKTPVVAAQHDV